MGKVSKFDLISARDIYLEGIGTIRQPRLSEIRDLGFDTYNNYLALISVDMHTLAKFFELPEEEIPEDLIPFDVFSIKSNFMELLLNPLRLFFVDKLEFSEKHKAIVTISVKNDKKSIGKIDRDNFSIVKNVIMEISGISVREDESAKPQNEKAKQIMERLAKGRAKMNAAHQNKKDAERNSLWNVIGAVAACSMTYNLTNIWQLTIAQLYDQFARINNRFYLDIMATRWCAWGNDKFEHDPWYSVPNE